MKTLSYKEEDGLITANIRGICRRVGKIGEKKEAIYGVFENLGSGIVAYEGYATHSEFLDDLLYINALSAGVKKMEDRYGLVENAKLINIDIFS